MNFKKELLFFVAVLIVTNFYGQKTWTLDACVSHAIANNLNLKDVALSANSGKETYNQSKRNLLPSISGYSDYNLRFGRSEDPNSGAYVNTDFFSNNYSVNASLDVFQGFQKINAIKASKYLYKANMEDIEKQKFTLAFSVMSAFYDIQYYQGLLAISKSKRIVSETNLKLVRKQIELGLKAGADIYEAESTLLADDLEVTQNLNLVQGSKLRLIQAINLEGENSIEIETNPLETYNDQNKLKIETDSIYTEALGFLPTIKAQRFRMKAAKKQVAIARGAMYPSLSIFAGYGTGYFETNIDANTNDIIPFGTQIEDNTSKQIGVSLRIPISDKWSKRSRIKQQKIELERASNGLKIEQQLVYQTIQQLVQAKNALSVEYKQTIKQLDAEEQAFKVAQKKYEKGLLSAVDLNEAKNLFATAQSRRLQAGLLLKVNSSTLDFYRGLPVFNINTNY